MCVHIDQEIRDLSDRILTPDLVATALAPAARRFLIAGHRWITWASNRC
ncbi:MAG TPA: hypothetical protein VF909_10325 [Roseiflexaceae bacterium]